MRIVIDMQGAQTESRFRGIGRYTLSFAQAIVRNRGEHEVFLALSGLFPDTIEPIRAAFDSLLPQENIRVWYAPGPVAVGHPGNDARREVAELIREAFLASLAPDVIHISSLFEGYVDDAMTSIGRFDNSTPVSVSLYDLIHLLNPDHYLKPNLCYAQYYQRKIAHLTKAATYLAISETAAQEGAEALSLPKFKFVTLAPTIDIRQHNAGEPLPPQSSEDDRFAAAVSLCDSDYWDQCAISAIAAFLPLTKKQESISSTEISRRPRLAFVSPLPPERTGIADYSAELLPALAHYYDIEVVVAQDLVEDPWVSRHSKVRDVNWLRANADNIDRVIYHIGNSPFHRHMLPLLREIPGVIVLHDFFLGHLMAYMEQYVTPHFWTKTLYSSHGYNAVRKRFLNPEAAVLEYPTNLGLLQHAQGVIVHSEFSRNLAQQWCGKSFANNLAIVPLLRSPASLLNKAAARKQLGLNIDDFVICSFGYLGSTKLNHRLLDAWLCSALASDRRCRLVFVGENHGDDYGSRLMQTIRTSGLNDRICITGFASPDKFRAYLTAADVAVQLRTHSRGETSAAVLDCMNYALPLIVNANGSMTELDREAVWLLPDEFTDAALTNALEQLWCQPEGRKVLGERAREIILRRHAPAECAKRYAEAIERFHRHAQTTTPALIDAIAAQNQFDPSDAELRRLSEALAYNQPLLSSDKRLFLDVTVTCRDDFKTGIQRVVRAIMLALLENPPAGYRIEPVYLSDVGGQWHFWHARRYTLGALGCQPNVLDDEIVEPQNGDVLLGLDLSGIYFLRVDDAGLFADYRNRGASLYGVVYDLLPVLMPESFPPATDAHHAQWLQIISKFAGAICISKAVADDLATWQAQAGLECKDRRPFSIGWFHLGADVANSAPSRGLPNNAEWVLRQFQNRPSFLMVGTIEPRKGYLQTIEAFTQLWAEGVDVNLVIVGREGWQGLSDDMRRDIPQTIDRLKTHPELDKRLFWLDGISDEYLEKVYAASTCLIAASYGEGFGLPLIESAQHKLPIIARDIPVFREVAGEHAFYFFGHSSDVISKAITDWLDVYRVAKHPNSEAIPYLTWEQSATQLMNVIVSHQRDGEPLMTCIDSTVC